MGKKTGPDLVFTTTNNEKVTHELEQLGEAFGKKFTTTPIATAVLEPGCGMDKREAANHMMHSTDVHQA